MNTKAYRCDNRHITHKPDFTDASYVDFEGEVHYEHIPICSECGEPVKPLSALSQAIVDTVRL